MRMTRRIIIQMAIFAVIATTALVIMVLGYMRLPTLLGVGQYRVTVDLADRRGIDALPVTDVFEVAAGVGG